MRLVRVEGELNNENQPLIGQISRDPSIFSKKFIPVYEQTKKLLVANMVLGARNVYSEISENDKKEVVREIEALFVEYEGIPFGGSFLQMEIYKPFALNKGWTLSTKYGEAVIRPKDLSPEQITEWETWLSSVDFIQQSRELTAKSLHNFIFPSISTKYRGVNIPLAVSLEESKRAIVRMFLPNITDSEANMIQHGYQAKDFIDTATLEDVF